MIIAQSIKKMHQYGSEFLVKYQFNILSNGFFISPNFSSKPLQRYEQKMTFARKQCDFFYKVCNYYSTSTALAASVKASMMIVGRLFWNAPNL